MQGFDFEIIYKKGKDYVVTNSLSRIEEASSLYSITSSILVWLEKSHHEWKNDNNMRQKIQCIKEGMNSMEHWEWKRDILWCKCRICLCP
jgi:viroplasmin and RNaseH domain-containing protein